VSELPAPQPGENARRIFERVRAARLRRAGAEASEPSVFERAYEKGAEGELRLGTRLNAAATARGGCWVLHDLVVPGARANIDHLVIGPAGVTVIDAKAWDGKVWVGRIGLGRGRSAHPKAIDGMSRQINRVHTVLAKAGRDDVPVEGVICMVNDNDGIPAHGFGEIQGVKVGRPATVEDHALRSGSCDVLTVEAVHRILAAGFEVHGGSASPTTRPATAVARFPPRRKAHRRMPRRIFRGVRAALLAMVMLGVLFAALAVVLTGFRATEKHYRSFSRSDLRAQSTELRRIATRRAHGRVRGPKLRVESASFVLAYRRGRDCRVVITVSRAVHVFGGGKHTVRSTGCARRHKSRRA
jgi:hypothetical protein